MLSKQLLFLNLLFLTFIISIQQAQAKQLTILYTGETHAALEHCDCPIAPNGGIARRATAIAQIRKEGGNVLLLDAGGTFAGGVYDEHTQGEKLDKIRTKLYLQAMEYMGYDVMSIGDEELMFGLDFLKELSNKSPIDFISANLINRDTNNPLLVPYVIKKIGQTQIAVIGLTTKQAKQTMPISQRNKINLMNPIESLKQTLTQIREKQRIDLVIVLSHLGEKKSRELLKKMPDINIVINSHTKESTEMIEKVGRGILLQFSYQGRILWRLDVELNEQNEIVKYNLKPIGLSSDFADDDKMLKLREGFEQTQQQAKVEFDLYVALDYCIYCRQAEFLVSKLVNKFADQLDFNLYFVPPKNMSETNAHMIHEAQVQLLIQKYFPLMLWDYLNCRNQDVAGVSWQNCAEGLKIDVNKISKALDIGEGKRLLEHNIQHAKQLRIHSTPNVFINHKPYKERLEEVAVSKYICGIISDKKDVAACKSLPECLIDDDCYRKGMLGSCKTDKDGHAKCSYRAAAHIPLIIVQSKMTMAGDTDIYKQLERVFPGIETEYIDAASPKGKRIISEYKIERLPAYIFSTALLKAKNIAEIKVNLKQVKNRLILSPSVTRSHTYIKRPYQPGKLAFLFSPLSMQSNKVLADIYEILDEKKAAVDFSLYYMIRFDGNGQLVAPNGQAELEEASRQMVIKIKYPKKFRQYLKIKNKKLDSSYWEEPFIELGLDPEIIKKMAASASAEAVLIEQAMNLEGLDIAPVPLFLVNNQELVELRNRQQFNQLLDKLKTLTAKEKGNVPKAQK